MDDGDVCSARGNKLCAEHPNCSSTDHPDRMVGLYAGFINSGRGACCRFDSGGLSEIRVVWKYVRLSNRHENSIGPRAVNCESGFQISAIAHRDLALATRFALTLERMFSPTTRLYSQVGSTPSPIASTTPD